MRPSVVAASPQETDGSLLLCSGDHMGILLKRNSFESLFSIVLFAHTTLIFPETVCDNEFIKVFANTTKNYLSLTVLEKLFRNGHHQMHLVRKTHEGQIKLFSAEKVEHQHIEVQ